MSRVLQFLFAFLIYSLLIQACKSAGKTVDKKQDALEFQVGANKPDSASFRKAGNKSKEEAMFIEACMQKMTGNTTQAVGLFRDVLDLNPMNAAANYELAGILITQRQADRALIYARRADSLQPANYWYKLRHAQTLTDLGQYEKAVRLTKELSERFPNNTAILFDYANSLHNMGNPQKTLEVYDRIEAIEGLSDTLTYCRIRELETMGNNAEIEKTYEKMILAFPRNESNYIRLGEFYRRSAQSSKLTSLNERYAITFPNSVTAQLQLAADYQKAGNHARAFEQTVKAFNIPNAPELKAKYLTDWYPAGDSIRISATNLKEADSLSGLLCRVHPDAAIAWFTSGNYMLLNNKKKEAQLAYRKAIALDRQPWQPWLHLLELNSSLNDEPAQATESKEATELFPQQPLTWYYYGALLVRQEKYKEAIDPLATGASYVFDNPSLEIKLKLKLAEAYCGLGDYAEADKICRRILDNDAENADAFEVLINSSVAQRLNLVEAENMAQKLISKEPNNANYQGLMGWVKYGSGQYADARGWFEKAMKTNPENPLLYERMGDVYYALQEIDEALRYWKLAKAKGSTSLKLEQKISAKKNQP